MGMLLQLNTHLLQDLRKIRRIYHGGHPVAHGCEFLTGVAREFKKLVVCVNRGKVSVIAAAEHRARDIVVKMKHLVLCLPLGGDVDAHGGGRRSAVFG